MFQGMYFDEELLHGSFDNADQVIMIKFDVSFT